MSSTRSLPILLGLAALMGLAILLRFLNHEASTPPIAALPPPAPTGEIPTLPHPPGRPAHSPPPPSPDQAGHPDARTFGTPALPPEQEPAALLALLECYRREFGSFPTGNENPHFLHALAGQNPSRLVIFPIRHPRVGPDGQLLDAWNSPFLFHPISQHHIEVRSAGPDREPFTADDLLAPPARPTGESVPRPD